VERREPARLLRTVHQAGLAALAHLVEFPEAVGAVPETHGDFGDTQPPEGAGSGSGILLADGHVVTHVAALRGTGAPVARLADGTEAPAAVRAYEPSTGMVLLTLSLDAPQPGAPLVSLPAPPGGLAVAAARSDGAEVVFPAFISAVGPATYTITAVGGPLPPGTPVYTLDVEALAVMGARPTLAFSLPEVLARLRAAAAEGRGLPRTIGVCLQDLTPAMEELVGAGVLVSDLLDGGPAEQAGLRAGDVLVRLDGAELSDVAPARRRIAALDPGRVVAATVRRQGKEQRVALRAAETLALHPCHRPAPAAASPRAGTFFGAEALTAAGVSPDAVVLSVDGVDAGRRPAARRPRSHGRLVHLQDGGRRFFAVVRSGS
jgi:S1-C subfamily serine protease